MDIATQTAHAYPWGVDGEHDKLGADEAVVAVEVFRDWEQSGTGPRPTLELRMRCISEDASLADAEFEIEFGSDEPLSEYLQAELRVLRETSRLIRLFEMATRQSLSSRTDTPSARSPRR